MLTQAFHGDRLLAVPRGASNTLTSITTHHSTTTTVLPDRFPARPCLCLCVSLSPACLRLGSNYLVSVWPLHPAACTRRGVQSSASASSASCAISLLSLGVPDRTETLSHSADQDCMYVSVPPSGTGGYQKVSCNGEPEASAPSLLSLDHPQPPDRHQMPFHVRSAGI